MLKRMRYRVILAAMLAFFAVIALIAVLVNAVNYYVVTARADQTISYIVNYETFSPGEADQNALPPGQAEPNAFPPAQVEPDALPPGQAEPNAFPPAQAEPDALPPAQAEPDAPPIAPFMALPDEESNYMTRFFIVRYDTEGNLLSISTDYVASIDESDALQYAEQALKSRNDHGYIKEYRYAKENTGDAAVIVFLNVSLNQQYMKTLQYLTLAVSGGALVLVFILVVLLSRRAIKPIADNIKRQKQFITDASHELKTPLTSISASVDVISMEHGDDEWTDNIRKQTGRMSHLVSELVTLSRLDEDIPLPNKELFSLSNAAWEIAEVYQPQAKARNKALLASIEDNISLFGEKSAIQQMLSVLLDNAIRYSDPDSEIRFSITRKRNKAQIEVFNTCHYSEPPDVSRLFDRFYRPDSSRNTSTGGTGVGLAIARAVAEAHGGTITASCPSGKTMTIKVVL